MDMRSKICIWIIVLGLTNFLAYTISYSVLQGEAIHGKVEWDAQEQEVVYKLNSEREVGPAAFIYSGIHSISIWLTVMAVLLAMLTLAKEQISDSLHEAMVRGRTFCTVLAVLIAISMSGLTFLFIGQFFAHMGVASDLKSNGGPPIVQPTSNPTSCTSGS